MIKDLNKLEQMLNTLACSQMEMLFKDRNEEAQDIEEAINCVRYAIAFDNKDKLLANFMVFESRNLFTFEDFIDNHTYICDYLGIAVRKFNGQYYAVKIMNPDSYFDGILTTDAPDNYPMHSFPETIIHSEYPEIVMLKVIEDYEKSRTD